MVQVLKKEKKVRAIPNIFGHMNMSSCDCYLKLTIFPIYGNKVNGIAIQQIDLEVRINFGQYWTLCRFHWIITVAQSICERFRRRFHNPGILDRFPKRNIDVCPVYKICHDCK